MQIKRRQINRILNSDKVLYGVFGIITSILNIVLFQVLIWTGLDYRYSNFITLVVVKLAAYLCNKNFVFQSKSGSRLELLKEFCRFVVARGATMIIDYFGLIFMAENLRADKFISKCLITVLVIAINYFVGKKHVFKTNR
ncbi:GtrA family protein [Clostridium sp. E02]|uniref:GtrA family protein n=1 Tax=Clostridium sp. E02 TaxID=2487134 RepID=UPI0013DDF8E4|nr:GtrA family protein [Clostridium sp. E02]